jgi:LysM repeat protein
MIAKGFDTTVSKIRQANNLKNDVIRVGQKLIIPAEGK